MSNQMRTVSHGPEVLPQRDRCGRIVDYLRISVTDRCNLRCTYCMGEEGVTPLPANEILRYEEILRIARVAASMGISRMRVTGGEPLVRRGVTGFLRELARVPGVRRLSLTTNGLLLEEHAAELFEAGVSRLNVSLDTLSREKYRTITRGGDLDRVLRGIECALGVGFPSIKINVVLVRAVNEEEGLPFAALSLDRPLQVRFIEWMPAPGTPWDKERFVPVGEILEACRSLGELVPEEEKESQGPVRLYRYPGARGTIGFISPLSSPFCKRCNRLRLTPEGKLKPCLHSAAEIDIREAARSGTEGDIARVIFEAIRAKPLSHDLGHGSPGLCRPMSRTGG